MFEVGDKVNFSNIPINENSFYDININLTYTIKHIRYSNGIISDIFLEEIPNTPLYHKRFEIDKSFDRNRKIEKIRKVIKNDRQFSTKIFKYY